MGAPPSVLRFMALLQEKGNPREEFVASLSACLRAVTPCVSSSLTQLK